MGKRRCSILAAAGLIAVIGILSGCGGNGSVTVTSVAITPTTATVNPGAQTDFTAVVNLSNTTTTSTTSTAVTWEVNGIVGGNSSVGTILSSTTDNQVGIYTAPSIVPSTNNGQVNITAVAQQPNTTSTTTSSGTTTSTTTTTTNTVTSNTAVVQIGVTPGFSINPSVTSVPAGGTIQFSSILNGVTDLNTTWTVTSSSGSNPGSIGLKTGLYTAPLSPPTGNSITVTGTDGTNSLSDTFSIAFSDHSLTGPYAFSYRGDNQLGFYAVAGSFVTDGNGDIESGVEDIDSFQTGVSTQIPITGNYTVGPDGRGTVHLSDNSNWRFALTTNQHGVMIRSDASDTGSGTIDQQSLNALSTTSPDTVLSGPYVFSGLGSNTTFSPLALAGKFSADGAGNIPAGNTILDINNGGSVTAADTTLSGSYYFDATFTGTGRGVLTLTSTTTGPRTYAFYVTDSTLLHFVETDHNAYLAGDAQSAPTGNSFSVASLASSNYAFTAGGNSSAGAYAAGGIFVSNGAGSMTGGAFDGNNAGTVQLNATLSSCPYSVDPVTGRIDLKLCGAGTTEFAAYQTASNSALLMELDTTAIATGVAYRQQIATTTPSGDFSFRLNGKGVFHNSPVSYQDDVEGQIVFNGTAATSGNLDINDFSEAFATDPINVGTITTTTNGTTTTTTASPINAPGSNGRGTLVITGTNPIVTYDLVYYLISANSALLFDQDKVFVLTGIITGQF
jgi:hypothetical protein